MALSAVQVHGEFGDTRYRFAQGLDYPAIVARSERVAWTVDEVFRGRRFDASRPIVPESWLRTGRLGFLDEQEQVILNHCRAFSYVHLLGNFEEVVPPLLAEIAGRDWHAQRAQLRALLRFSDEEMKHQELFLRVENVMEESCGHRFGRYFDEGKERVSALSEAILGYPPLARFLLVLSLEWGTQRHYLDAVGHQSGGRADPLYADILKAHWIEEAQHTKSDMIEIARLAAEMSPGDLSLAFDHLIAIGGLVDTAFVGQAAAEVETLERVTGRRLSDGERTVLRQTLHDSLSASLASVGLTHPSFVEVALELSTEGAAKLGIERSAPAKAVVG